VPFDDSKSIPAALDGGTVMRIPRRYREDAVQEAWVAHLAGRDPNAAVWAYVKRRARTERKSLPFSQLDEDQQRLIFQETAG
jgi:hypothetical protein